MENVGLLLEQEVRRSRKQRHTRRKGEIILYQGEVLHQRLVEVDVVQVVVVGLGLHEVQHTIVTLMGLLVFAIPQIGVALPEGSLNRGPFGISEDL